VNFITEIPGPRDYDPEQHCVYCKIGGKYFKFDMMSSVPRFTLTHGGYYDWTDVAYFEKEGAQERWKPLNPFLNRGIANRGTRLEIKRTIPRDKLELFLKNMAKYMGLAYDTQTSLIMPIDARHNGPGIRLQRGSTGTILELALVNDVFEVRTHSQPSRALPADIKEINLANNTVVMPLLKYMALVAKWAPIIEALSNTKMFKDYRPRMHGIEIVFEPNRLWLRTDKDEY
jgi:hypothetical protein